MPTELELIALESEFKLYLPFSKRLVLNLPDSKDRARAAQWLLKLRSVRDDNGKKLRNEHLKLLLFALHRRTMVGLFGTRPPKDDLESFHDGLTLLEMTRELIEINEKAKQVDAAPEGECPLPKVFANFSSDLREYTASQQIPKFGAHVYYAVSNEPINYWAKSPKGVYPSMGDVPNAMQWEQSYRKLTDDVLAQQAEMDRKMELQKEIEAGRASPDELDDQINFNKKINVPVCNSEPFKWKNDSLLRVWQNYDFWNIKDADDIATQGKAQLEADEEAYAFLDYTIPGRRQINVRDPYYDGLPPDIAARRHHGTHEDIPFPDEDDEDDECDVCSCHGGKEDDCKSDDCPCSAKPSKHKKKSRGEDACITATPSSSVASKKKSKSKCDWRVASEPSVCSSTQGDPSRPTTADGKPPCGTSNRRQRKKPKGNSAGCSKSEDKCSPPKSCKPKTPVRYEDPCLAKSCAQPMRIPDDPPSSGANCCEEATDNCGAEPTNNDCSCGNCTSQPADACGENQFTEEECMCGNCSQPPSQTPKSSHSMCGCGSTAAYTEPPTEQLKSCSCNACSQEKRPDTPCSVPSSMSTCNSEKENEICVTSPVECPPQPQCIASNRQGQGQGHYPPQDGQFAPAQSSYGNFPPQNYVGHPQMNDYYTHSDSHENTKRDHRRCNISLDKTQRG